MIDISELHDTFEKISDATKVLIVGKQIDAIGKMISAMAEAQIQNELEQKYKDLGIQVQEDPVTKLLKQLMKCILVIIFLLNALNLQNKIYLLLRRE